MQNSGINMGSLTKGLIGFIAPMIMGKMLNKGLQSSNASSGLGQAWTSGHCLGDQAAAKELEDYYQDFLNSIQRIFHF